MSSRRDLTGIVFGKLTAISPTHTKSGRPAWVCRCECGNETTVISYNLTSGKIKSCGKHKEYKYEDLTGKIFGRLTVLEQTRNDKGKISYKCHCECGKDVVMSVYSLMRGAKSCGCMRYEHASNALRKHGMTHSRMYNIWANMKTRCYNQHTEKYIYYGGKGITVCDEWRDNFKTFYDWSMSHGYSDTLTIDRIDSNLGYSPDNCRWVTMLEQNRNKESYKALHPEYRDAN